MGIFKKLEYFNENDKIQIKEQLIMDISESEVIGEDYIWFNRENQYTAKVTNGEVRTLIVDNSSFLSHFGKVKEIQLRQFKIRSKFIDERYKKLRFGAEY